MVSPGGASCGSTQFPSSGQQIIMDERKRKRMISNRESARRSRMRKQNYLDDLTAQLTQLSEENHRILTRVNVTAQLYLNVEAENSVLQAQLAELTHRLSSLIGIIDCLNTGVCKGDDHHDNDDNDDGDDQDGIRKTDEINGDDFFNPRNLLYGNQPIMDSPDEVHLLMLHGVDEIIV